LRQLSCLLMRMAQPSPTSMRSAPLRSARCSSAHAQVSLTPGVNESVPEAGLTPPQRSMRWKLRISKRRECRAPAPRLNSHPLLEGVPGMSFQSYSRGLVPPSEVPMQFAKRSGHFAFNVKRIGAIFRRNSQSTSMAHLSLTMDAFISYEDERPFNGKNNRDAR
jgi:hypothetical protein